MKKIILIIAIALLIYSCSEESTSPNKPSASIDELIRNAGGINTAVSVTKNEQIGQTISSTVTENNEKWNVKEKKMYLSKNLDNNIIPFNPNANTLWAGALVQGKEVPNGILNSLGDNISRAPISITVNSGSSNFGNAKN